MSATTEEAMVIFFNKLSKKMIKKLVKKTMKQCLWNPKIRKCLRGPIGFPGRTGPSGRDGIDCTTNHTEDSITVSTVHNPYPVVQIDTSLLDSIISIRLSEDCTEIHDDIFKLKNLRYLDASKSKITKLDLTWKMENIMDILYPNGLDLILPLGDTSIDIGSIATNVNIFYK